jgi:hypothetical protein
MWIGDTGALCHFTNNDESFIDWKRIHEVVAVGDGSLKVATKIGTIRLEVQQRNGKKSIILLAECKFCKGLRNNLFCIT